MHYHQATAWVLSIIIVRQLPDDKRLAYADANSSLVSVLYNMAAITNPPAACSLRVY